MIRGSSALVLAALLCSPHASAQVSAYTFSSSLGTWQPLGGAGSLLGMPGMPPAFNFYDDNSFVTQGESILLGTTTTGNGWPIGFTFHFNGQPYDRVGLSIEGWLAFGNSSNGPSAVHVPVGSPAYTPLSSENPSGIAPLLRNRVAGFAMDLAAQGSGGTWPLQLITAGTAPNRTFIAEWNVVRSGGSSPLSFQVKLSEGGGDPAQQTVQVVYGTMAQSVAHMGQVGLGGTEPADFNNRSVTNSPYDWQLSQAGTVNTANCRLPSSATYLPQGLTFTWTPAGCQVSGIAISGLNMTDGGIAGSLSWNALDGASSYDYVITAGGPGDTPVLNGTGITGTTVALSGLPAGQQLFAYVKADCAAADGWGAGLPFSTANIVEVVCGGPSLAFTHCYDNLEQATWHYNSSSAAPLRMFIHAGTIFNGDLLKIYDGNSDQAPLLFSSSTGAIAGQMITSSGGAMTMKLTSDDGGSCASQDFIPPMEWEVGCLDCDPVLANYQVVDDCANGQYTVQVNIFSLGTASAATITNSLDGTEVPVPGSGLYTAGPFPNGSPVVISVNNAYNAFCTAVSNALVNGTCPVVSCGPDTYNFCYANNDHSQFAFQSDNNDRIGIRFLSGTLGTGDALYIYDGLDPLMSTPLFTGNNGGDLTGLLVTSTLANPDNALLLEVAANGSGSCATGQGTPWEYVVECYDGCTPPAATFTTARNCDQGTFTVEVTISAMGSSTSLAIANNGGMPGVTATAPGTFTMGPFAITDTVVADVQGNSQLCSLNSTPLHENCAVGINESTTQRMHVFPNPGDGTFRMVMPEGFGGQGQLEVLSIDGQRAAVRVLHQNSSRGVDCYLGHLPAGFYTLVLTDGVKKAYASYSLVK